MNTSPGFFPPPGAPGSASLSAPAALLGSASALLAAQICGKAKPRDFCGNAVSADPK